MNRIIIPVICFVAILLTLLNIDPITDHVVTLLSPSYKNSNNLNDTNYKNGDFEFISNTTNFTPYGKQDILNIFYTILNNKNETGTFYCPKEYKNCIEDVTTISKDQNLLTHLNNFLHPYKSFAKIKSDIFDTGEIQIKIDYIYSLEEINYLETETEKLIQELITDDITEDYDKLKVIHDYIINNTKYDVNDNKDIKSYNAYGALNNHLATCNGYSDLMSIFLTKLGYTNYKIATTNENTGHVWNAVFLSDKWLHLDLTWDDPVSSDGKDYLYHKYFLIDTEGLMKADENITSQEHEFNQAIYSELKTIQEEEQNENQ